MQTINVLTNSKKPSKQLKALVNKVDEINAPDLKSNSGANFLNFLWGKYIKLHHTEKQALNFEQICKLTLNKFLGHE